MKEFSDRLPLTVKQSAAIFAFRVLLIEVIFTSLNFFIVLGNNIVENVRGVELFEGVFTETLIFFTLMAIRFIFVGFIVIQWLFEYYEVDEDEIIHRRGLILQHTERYPLRNIESFTINQGAIGKLFKFGSVTLRMPIIRKSIHLDSIPYPEQFCDILSDVLPVAGKPKIIFNQGR